MSYEIYVDGSLIYSAEAAAIDRRFVIADGELKEEQNKIAAFVLELPPDHAYYAAPKLLKSTITLYDGSELLYKGRPRKETDGFYNTRKLQTESELGFLADIPDTFTSAATEDNPVAVNTLFASLMAGYAAAADAGRVILAGTCDITATCDKAGSGSCWKTLETWAKNYNGYITLRHENGDTYLDFKTTSGTEDQTQAIRYGVNMTDDFERMIDTSAIRTGVLAIGGTPEGASAPVDLNGYSGTENGVLFNATARALYGSIYERVVFEDCLTQADLATAAGAWLNNLIAAALSLKMGAVENKMLGLAPEHMRIGNWYPVISEPHGIDTLLPLKKRTLKILEPDKTATELGADITTLSVMQAGGVQKTATAMTTASEALKTAKAAATPAMVAAAIAASESRVADYIESFGTDTSVTGITWHWEKWHSGKAVCYGVAPMSIASGGMSAVGSLYYKTASIAFPSGLFNADPDLNPSVKTDNDSGGWIFWIAKQLTSTKTTAYYTVMRHSNPNKALVVSVNLHAIGSWK